MTNKYFKEIRTGVYTLEKVHQPTSGKIPDYNKHESFTIVKDRESGKLTRNQLEYFEFLNDFEIDKPQRI